MLPSHFLQEAVAGFLSRLRQHQAAVAELEQVLLASSSSGGALEGLLALAAWPGLLSLHIVAEAASGG